MEEQGQGSKQILEAIGDLNNASQEVTHRVYQMREGSQEVIRESLNLENTTVEISEGINEISGSAEQIDVAVGKVQDITIRNKESIEAPCCGGVEV